VTAATHIGAAKALHTLHNNIIYNIILIAHTHTHTQMPRQQSLKPVAVVLYTTVKVYTGAIVL